MGNPFSLNTDGSDLKPKHVKCERAKGKDRIAGSFEERNYKSGLRSENHNFCDSLDNIRVGEDGTGNQYGENGLLPKRRPADSEGTGFLHTSKHSNSLPAVFHGRRG